MGLPRQEPLDLHSRNIQDFWGQGTQTTSGRTYRAAICTTTDGCSPPHTFPVPSGDSGIYPLYMEGIARAIDYYYLVDQSPPESLLGTAMKTQRQLADCGVQCWLAAIRLILTQLRVTDGFDDPPKSAILEKLRLNYHQGWYDELWTPKANGRLSKRLKWYRQIKYTMAKEAYLNGVKSETQVALARFRLGGHGLPVETKRWKGVRYRNRTCDQCSTGAIGDELHIFQCEASQHRRAQLKIKRLCKRQFLKMLKNPQPEHRRYIRDTLADIRYTA